MGYIRGEAREQTAMFPVTLEELIPAAMNSWTGIVQNRVAPGNVRVARHSPPNLPIHQ
jgi:hypothetical protein